ncbi:MAG TPA: translation elongation factor Ts [Dehalococcoidia bacterium]|nr:translation elongation factor Ts [Dehalococcoidia bacterium]
MQIPTSAIKELREKTGAGVMDCKKALLDAEGNMEKATEILHKRGLAMAIKKADRTANEGIVEAYVHPGGRIGVLVEVNCETDFVARTQEFKELAHNLALQIAAMSPQALSSEDMSEQSGEDPETACLLFQPFIKDPNKTVQDIITETIAKVGENIRVRRFIRFELGC